MGKTPLLLVVSLLALAGQGRTFDFAAGKWDRGAFFEARNDDWNRGDPIVQMPDCVMNANDPKWTDEDLFKNHQADVYSSLILTNRFRGDITFSSKMSFDHRMAPSLVIAGEFATDAEGRKAFRDIYEIVLFEDGLNVWRHRRPNGGKSEIEKVAYTSHVFKKRTPYVLTVELKRKKAYGGRLTTDVKVSADGAEVGFRDETVPAVYSVGLLGSEGRCRFYDFTVDDVALAESAQTPAGLSFGRPFTDGAVLQRDRPVPVWGRAPAGAEVRVTYGAAVVKGKADEKGDWRVKLPAMPASSVPRSLSVATATSTLHLDNVVVGEVWLCAGQSNMAMALVHPTLTRYRDGVGAMVAQATDQPLVRYLGTPVPKDGWQAFAPAFLASGSKAAIAVHYALELHEKLGIPVGVIVAAVGGCNIDSFLPDLKPASNLDRYLLDGVYPYAVRGALWYQGETNIYLGEVGEYGVKLRSLYDRWRTNFENPKLSFYYVQLAPFARGGDYDTRFPRFLCLQAAFEREEPNAAMTVINDLGVVGDIHPNEKWLVAKRLALHALRRDYGFANVEDCSPEPIRATAVSNVVTVVFDHAKTLYAYQRGQRFSPNLPFELSGADGVWKPAKVLNFLTGKSMCEGTITNNVIELTSPDVAAPTAVRYAWKLPWTGSVYNEVNLPLGTFMREVLRENVVTNGMTLVRSSLDGTLQPCYVKWPSAARGAVPLLVGLHSWSGCVEWAHPRELLERLAAERGWAFVYPHFRGCNDNPAAGGSDAAVGDVLDGVAWMKDHANIDADRVYLAGGSGGAHMALLAAARSPGTFAGVAAFCPITDLMRWHAEGLRLGTEYPAMLEGVCGGTPAVRGDEYVRRSPLGLLDKAEGPVFYIAAGIHDGHGDQPVPPGHSMRAYNALAGESDRISEEDIAFVDACAKAPASLAFAGSDPFYPADRRIHLRRTSERVRLTLFEAGHRDNYPAAVDFLARQRRGSAPDWTLPETATGGCDRNKAITR